MSQSISIPPLIPLPNDDQSIVPDENEDVFATLFSPATPRGSPTMQPVPDEAPRPAPRHSRTASAESDFGSFVSVPSAEHPLHPQDEEGGFVPFTPTHDEFFDKFTEDAKVATEKNKTQLLDELIQSDKDPAAFLRGAGENDQKKGESLHELIQPEADTATPTNRSRAATPLANKPLIPTHPVNANPIKPVLIASNSSPLPSVAPTTTQPSKHILGELVHFEEEPAHFVETVEGSSSHETTRNNDVSLSDFDPFEDEHLERMSRHPVRRSSRSESVWGTSREHSPEQLRSPSLPPSPTRISTPEVQRTQSFFAPSSLVSSTSNFTSRWMSSLLSRPQPPPPSRPKTPEYEDYGGPPLSLHRSVTAPGPSITHGTPFAAQPYIPPSGAPGFAGDRTWDKGFKFDKEHVERTSVKLNGRKEITVGVLTVALADKLRPYLPALKRLARSWLLLYSLDQHGISLNTLYTRCEAHTGSALLVLRDSNDAVFGVWMGEGIKQCKGSYYGSGESFLFRVLPDDTLRVYKWSGKNDYVALCEPEYISFGGGDGHYGLYLDDTLSDGSSARCPTFDNEPLCSPGPRQGENVTFECVGLEVWGVG